MFTPIKDKLITRKINKLSSMPLFQCKYEAMTIKIGSFGKHRDDRMFREAIAELTGTGLEMDEKIINPTLYFDENKNLVIKGDNYSAFFPKNQIKFLSAELNPNDLFMKEDGEFSWSYFSSKLELQLKNGKDIWIYSSKKNIKEIHEEMKEAYDYIGQYQK